MSDLAVIGGGLAGSEAAWQAAQRGLEVTLSEMRPQRMTPAHVSPWLAELVCSNSLGSNLVDRAPGLLKQELRRLDSLIVASADATGIPVFSETRPRGEWELNPARAGSTGDRLIRALCTTPRPW